jgi:hypothetical protein
MKLIDYLNECKNVVGRDIVAIRYYCDDDLYGYESDNVNITDKQLIFDDLVFDLNIKGQVVDGIFKYVDDEGVSVGIESWF